MEDNIPRRPNTMVLEEEIEENYQPTIEELIEYAEWLGMSLPRDEDLLWIAKDGLTTPLPESWKPCRTEDDEIFYFNFETEESIWDHPCDGFHRTLYESECTKLGRLLVKHLDVSSKGVSTSSQLQDFSESISEEAGSIFPNSHSREILEKSAISQQKLQEEVLQSSQLHTTQEKSLFSQHEKKQGKYGEENKTNFCNDDEDNQNEMRQRVRTLIEEEESLFLQQARQAMRERVDRVLQVEEQALLSNKRASMSSKVAKHIEEESSTKIAKRNELHNYKENKIQIDKEELRPLKDNIETHIEIYEEKVKQEQKRELEKDAEIQSQYKVAHQITKKIGQHAQVEKEFYDSCTDPNDRTPQDPTLTRKSVVQSRASSRVLSSYSNNSLQDDEETNEFPYLKETVQKAKDQLKLEELVLINEMKDKMLVRVSKTIDALEKSIFEAEHKLATMRVQDKVEEQVKAIRVEVELQMILEKDLVLKEKREELKARILKLIRTQEIMEMENKNAMRCQEMSCTNFFMPPTRQLQSQKANSSPMVTTKKPSRSVEVQKEAYDGNTNMPTCSQVSNSESDEKLSLNDSYKLEVSGASQYLSTSSGPLAELEKQMSDLLKIFKQDLNEELHKFKCIMEQFSLPYLVDLPMNRIIPNEPNSMVSFLKEWIIKVENKMKEFMLQCKKELVAKMHTSKNKVIEEFPSSDITLEDKCCQEIVPQWQEKHMWCAILHDTISQSQCQRSHAMDIQVLSMKCEAQSQLERKLEKEKRVFCNILNDAIEKWLWHQRKISYSDIRSKQEGGKDVQEFNERHFLQQEEKMREMMIDEPIQSERTHHGEIGSFENVPLTQVTQREHQLKPTRYHGLHDYQCRDRESSCIDKSSNNWAIGVERSYNDPSKLLEHMSMEDEKKRNISDIDQGISHTNSSRVLACTSKIGEDQEQETKSYLFQITNQEETWNRGNFERSLFASLYLKYGEKIEIFCGSLIEGMKKRIAKFHCGSHRSINLQSSTMIIQTRRKRTNLQGSQLQRWMEWNMKWIVQKFSCSWRQREMMCHNCGIYIKKLVKYLDSRRAILFSLVQKLIKECHVGGSHRKSKYVCTQFPPKRHPHNLSSMKEEIYGRDPSAIS